MTRTPVWKWMLALVVVAVGAAIAIPLYRFADRDDAPGGMVIAMLIFVLGAAYAARLVSPQRAASKPGSH